MRPVGPANTRRTGFSPSLLFSNTRATIARCPCATGGSRAARYVSMSCPHKHLVSARRRGGGGGMQSTKQHRPLTHSP
eukprot:1455509-Rhodomonas_salina.1